MFNKFSEKFGKWGWVWVLYAVVFLPLVGYAAISSFLEGEEDAWFNVAAFFFLLVWVALGFVGSMAETASNRLNDSIRRLYEEGIEEAKAAIEAARGIEEIYLKKLEELSSKELKDKGGKDVGNKGGRTKSSSKKPS